jgi:hypothetical protein
MRNDLTQWNLPWHELQRSLAAGLSAHAAAARYYSKPLHDDVCCVPTPASSWLIRARTRVLPAGGPPRSEGAK